MPKEITPATPSTVSWDPLSGRDFHRYKSVFTQAQARQAMIRKVILKIALEMFHFMLQSLCLYKQIY